jgi:hypothetical protein
MLRAIRFQHLLVLPPESSTCATFTLLCSPCLCYHSNFEIVDPPPPLSFPWLCAEVSDHMLIARVMQDWRAIKAQGRKAEMPWCRFAGHFLPHPFSLRPNHLARFHFRCFCFLLFCLPSHAATARSSCRPLHYARLMTLLPITRWICYCTEMQHFCSASSSRRAGHIG